MRLPAQPCMLSRISSHRSASFRLGPVMELGVSFRVIKRTLSIVSAGGVRVRSVIVKAREIRLVDGSRRTIACANQIARWDGAAWIVVGARGRAGTKLLRGVRRAGGA